MRKFRLNIFTAFAISSMLLVFLANPLSAGDKEQETASLNEHLEPFRPYIGKTWRGEAANSTPDKPVVDISRWERAMNGQAIRILHSLNDGEYGGETIIVWDAKKESLVFYYFTTGGFYTHGTVWFEEGKMISHEYVVGNENGITEVKAIGEVLPDGRMHSTSQYLKNGNWEDGHEFYYSEAPGAEVIFR